MTINVDWKGERKTCKSIQLVCLYVVTCVKRSKDETQKTFPPFHKKCLNLCRRKEKKGEKQKWTDSYLLSNKSNKPHRVWWESFSKLGKHHSCRSLYSRVLVPRSSKLPVSCCEHCVVMNLNLHRSGLILKILMREIELCDDKNWCCIVFIWLLGLYAPGCSVFA